MVNPMTDSFAAVLERRLVQYVQIDTQANEHSTTVPSTTGQLTLLALLADELRAMGARDVRSTDCGAVVATIPATLKRDVPRIAFLAHVDTAPDFTGTNVKPIVHRNYGGAPIVLPDDTAQVLDPAKLPYLATKVGDDIITASGTTLLGADDKSGVAVLMTFAEYLLAHPELPHGAVRIGLTIDEEIGTGVDHLDLGDLAADFAYTLDGADVGELVYETFSANKGVVEISGVAIHPSVGYGVLVNALTLAAAVVAKLPSDTLTPQTTRDREGFIHLYAQNGDAASCTLSFLLRDFELDKLASHGKLLQQACADVADSEPRANITCTITPQYRNMHDVLAKDMRPVDLAAQAMRNLGIEPDSTPIRGGTDGSKLSELGLPTPNLFTGMQAFHGPHEWISVQDMVKSTEVCVELVQLGCRSATD